MRRFCFNFLIILGTVIGLWHFRIAMVSIFVFRSGEPYWSWAEILLGPASTLLAVVLGVRKPTAAGWWLLSSAGAATVVFGFFESPKSEFFAPYMIKISLPMFALGMCFLLCARYITPKQKNI